MIIMRKWGGILRILLLMVTTACLWACSAGDDSGSEEREGRAGRESSAGLGQFAEEKGSIWDDTWTAKTASGDSVQVNLTAFVEVPDLEQMSTVEVQRYEFNEENKRKAAEGIFGEVFLNDEKHLPVQEIRELLDTWLDIERAQQKALEELKQEEGKEGEIKDLESDLKTDRATVKRYERLLKKAPDDFVRAEADFSGKEYTGTREGVRYRLDFVTEKEGAFERICMEPYEIEDIYPGRLKGKGESYYCIGGDIKLESANQCHMGKEEAEKTARQFLQKAGFGGLILTGEETLQWIDGGERNNRNRDSMLVDGWHFTFSPGAEDVPLNDYVDFFDYSGGITESDTMIYWDKRFSPDCSISIDVTDRGVIQANLANPVTVISSVPGVKLLPLADIKNVIRNDIGKFSGLNQKKKRIPSASYNRLTLGYYRVSDPGHDNLYTYLPAWRLWSNKNDSPSFVVNAMDGSVIDDWEEKWEIVDKTKR